MFVGLSGRSYLCQPSVNATSVTTPHCETAEEAAIALAIILADADAIISDSKKAIKNFLKGRVAHSTMRILSNFQPLPKHRRVELIWVLAHERNPENEAAHLAAQGFINRAVFSELGLPPRGPANIS